MLNIRFFALSLLIGLTLLAGCTTTPRDRDRASAELEASLQTQVAGMIENGDYAGAASLLENAARMSESPLREQLLLKAAGYWLKAGNQERSLMLVEQLRPTPEPSDFNFELRMLRTELAVLQGDIEKALDLMQPEPAPDTPLDLKVHYHRNMAEIFRLSGNLLESARELDVLDQLQEEDPEGRLATQQLLLQTLTTMTDTALSLLQPQPPSTLIGWMELARIVKQQISDPIELNKLLGQWRERFPDHPAMQPLLAGLLEQQGLTPDDHIAVLLPRSGPYAKVAAAVRDGFMAAWYQQPAEYRPKLQFYDTGTLQETLSVYQSALLNGAQMIVGPLDKDAVKMISRLELMDVPVLALNQIEEDEEPRETINPNLYQFGLAPEDEAEQVAERAWLEGHRSALILTPSDDWGNRLAASFRSRWQRLGGVVVEQQVYDPRENDFSVPIRMLLNINESEARIRALVTQLGRKVEAEPRPRQDADFIFLAARPQKARQLRPQLRFFRAGNLPVYTTSHVYSGIPDPTLDRDLGKIEFVDTPWLLEEGQEGALSRQELEKLMPGVKGVYARIYAMGIDSYNLLPQLRALQEQPGRLFNGKSGTLYLDRQNRLHRLLAWAEMDQGQAHISGYAPRLEMPALEPLEPLTEDSFEQTPESRGSLPPVEDRNLSQPAATR
ncbi:MAG: penicillin-binding protein activator [Candidatus Thiodiazotropha sp.]